MTTAAAQTSAAPRYAGPQAGVLAVAVLGFVAVTVWWWSRNTTMLDFDSGIHMNLAFYDATALGQGNLSAPFTIYTTYPPLVHLIGALAILCFGMHPMALVIVNNLVFVPLLACGCYGVGTLIAGKQAGMLAGLFALGTPMFTSMMHAYDLDPAQAAMVAVSVWALLASDRFARVNIAALAGVACGLALMTKETSVLFLAGIIGALLCRGGYRNRRGLAALALGLGVVAGPWYLVHLGQLLRTFTAIGGLRPNPAQAPPLLSGASAGWYFWDLVNQQVGGPLALAFFAGLLTALRRLRTGRAGYLPELLTGAVTSYVGITCLTHKDPRYSLPALVYVAVIATYWLPALGRSTVRRAAAAGLVAIALVDSLGVSTGLGGADARLMVSVPRAHASLIYPGSFTIYENEGYVRGAPSHDGDPLALLRAMRREGIRSLAVDPDVDALDYSVSGLLPLADATGLRLVFPPRSGVSQRYLLIRRLRAGGARPCQTIEAGRVGVYVLADPVTGFDAATARGAPWPAPRYTLACPR